MLAIRGNRPVFPNVFGRDFDRLIQGMFSPAVHGASPSLYPALNLHETENAFTIEAELPGFTEEDVELGVQGDVLTLKGSRTAETQAEGSTYHRRERWSGSFERTLRLPTDIDAEKVSATLTNGVLTITLPKPAAALPRKISVKGA